MFQKAIYLTQEAFRTLGRHKGVTTISVIIMSLSLLMLAVFLLATDNLLKIIGEAEQDIKVYVYLDDRVDYDGVQKLHNQIFSMDEVESVVFMSREEAEMFLNRWITGYVTPDDSASPAAKAERPLREARIDVAEVPGKPGVYKAVAFLRPHFQLDELTVSLRLVAELPAPVK